MKEKKKLWQVVRRTVCVCLIEKCVVTFREEKRMYKRFEKQREYDTIEKVA